MRDATGSMVQTHLCDVFDDHADFRARAIRFLADGLARGNRVRYAGTNDLATLQAEVAPLRPRAGCGSAIDVVALRPGMTIDGPALVASYAADTRTALADGFTGFRVAADSTLLVRTAEQLDAFARYEHRVDRYMAGAPFTGMCGFARTALGDAAVTQLACLHPAGSAGRAPFRVHASPDADVAISGELDLATVDLFATTMDRVGLHDAPAEVVVDVTGLVFADHRNLLVLERLARRYERSIVLRTARRWPERLVTALRLTRVRVARGEPGTALI